MPKISIGTWAFAFGPFSRNPWTITRVLQFASKAGYDGVELNGFRPHPHPDDYPTKEQRKLLRDELRANGLGVSGYAPDFTHVPPALTEPIAYLETMKRCIDFAADVGTNIIRVDTVTPPEELPKTEYETRFTRLVHTWQVAAELAQDADMIIVWEFEPGFWLNKPSEVQRLIESVNHPSFRILFDTSHAYMSGVVGARQTGIRETLPGGIVQYAKMLEGYIGHFHVIDSDGTLHDEETSTHAEFGHGKIDFQSVLATLKDTIFGLEWWCVDFCFNAEVERWAKDAIAFLQSAVEGVGR
ncbi:MAG: sugar phosphate isomerase/epimerase [Alicyclobacillus sp.]|nr:sugar phosphate isomerase/epimerase [Alicyclobacillus sp.]